MARLKDLLARRSWRFFETGQYELISPTYACNDFYPLLNLVEFAKDCEVARNADAEATLNLLLLKAHSYHGVIIPPLTRHNVDQTNAPVPEDWPPVAAVAQHILWYYCGEPRLDRFDFVKKSREPYYVIMPALSSWRPPAAAYAMPTEGYAVRYATPEASHWDDPTFPTIYGDTYIGRGYALATGNMVFAPCHYCNHNQTFAVAWQSDARRNLLEIQHPYWSSDFGEDAWRSDFWSPFVQGYRIDNQRAVLLAAIPAADPWTEGVENRFWIERVKHKDALIRMVQCRIPRAVDELLFDGAWVFFRKGPTHVALAALKGAMEVPDKGLPAALAADFTVIKVREAKTAFFVMVDDGGGPFKDFQNRAKAAVPVYDNHDPSITTKDALGRPVIVRFNPPSRDDRHDGYWLFAGSTRGRRDSALSGHPGVRGAVSEAQ